MTTHAQDLEKVVNEALAEDALAEGADATAPYLLNCNTPEFYNNDEDVPCERAKE